MTPIGRVSVATLLALASGAALAAEPAQVVVAVGVNASFDPGLTPLSFAETDAERFAHTMETVGGVPPRATILLRNPTVDEFVSAVRYQVRLEHAERLTLYFSGHADERGLHFRGGALSRRRLQDLLTQVDVQTKVLVIDSCYSGSIVSKGVTPDAPFDLPKLDMDQLTGSVFLTASAGGEAAYESEELSGGLFTHDVIAGLNGAADANSDGLVTVDELYQYVYRETRLRSLTYNGRGVQHPEFHADLHGHGALVLAKPRQALATLRVDPGVIGTVHLASMNGLGSFAVFGQPASWQEFHLPEGTYHAVIRRGDMVGETSLMIARNEPAELRAGQFSWSTATMAAPRTARGGASVAASSLYMVAMRQALGNATMDSLVAETDRELVSVATARQRLSIMGAVGVEQSQGVVAKLGYQENGIDGQMGLLVARSDVAVRGVFGLGLTREYATITQDIGHHQFRASFSPSAYAGMLLPLGATASGNWSVAARREVHWIQDILGNDHQVDQYLVGLVVEP